MNIAMLQTIAPTKMQQTPSAKQTDTTSAKSEGFGSVFKKIISSKNEPTSNEKTSTESVAEEIESTLSTDSLEELLEKLGVKTDEAGLFIFVGEEKTPIAMDEFLTLGNLSEVLGLTEQQVVEMLEQLLGDAQQQTITDIWSLLEQAPAILSEVLAALQGTQQKEGQLDELQQITQLLKMAQLLGNKTDLTYKQEQQISQIKELLQTVLSQLKQGEKQTGLKTTQESAIPVGLQQQQGQIKVMTVTLPTEKAAQSEALIKEIQNLMNRSQLSGQQGNMKLFLKLFPENLGQIRIELVQKDGVMTARLLASTSLGKELLDGNINQLKAGFVAQNIQMDRIDVAQTLQDADRNTRDQNFFNNFFRQQEQDEPDENENGNEEEKITFSDLLSEEVQ